MVPSAARVPRTPPFSVAQMRYTAYRGRALSRGVPFRGVERAQASALPFEINFCPPPVTRGGARNGRNGGGPPPETMLLGDPTSIRETFSGPVFFNCSFGGRSLQRRCRKERYDSPGATKKNNEAWLPGGVPSGGGSKIIETMHPGIDSMIPDSLNQCLGAWFQ